MCSTSCCRASVRPSSSPSSDPPGLFDGVLARGAVRAAVSDGAWLQALLDVEAALARAGAAAGVFPAQDAEAIAGACRAEDFDPAALGAQAAASGNPVVPLVRALTAAVPASAAGRVHLGATSQDVLDSAAMLVSMRALEPLLADLDAAAAAAAALAAAHRDTPMAGRTLLQQALPITFGLKAAGWLAGLDAASARLAEVRRTRLCAQLGGAAGTLASLGEAGPAVLRHLAELLGLCEPVLPWHTERSRVIELAAALGGVAAAVGKVAGDIVLLAQSEVGEVAEGAPGGSSTLPHKRNPVAAVSAIACAAQAPGLVATLLAAAAGAQHERAAGAWHAEWRPLRELLRSTGSAAAWLEASLAGLQVDATAMRANLERTGGVLLAERVTSALAPLRGRLAAHDLVSAAAAEAAAGTRSFAEALAARDAPITGDALEPAGYLGSAGEFVDRALRVHGARLDRDLTRDREQP